MVLGLVWVVLALVLVRDLVVSAARHHRSDQTEALSRLGKLLSHGVLVDVAGDSSGDERTAGTSDPDQLSRNVRIVPAPPRPRLVPAEAGESDLSRQAAVSTPAERDRGEGRRSHQPNAA